MARDLDQPAVAAGSSHGTRAVSFADRRTCSRIQQQACGIEGVLVGMPSGSGDSSSDDDEAPSSMFLAAAERHDGRHAVGHSSGGVDRTSNGSSSGAVPALQLLAQQPAGPRPCAAPSSQRRQLQVQSRRGGVSHTLLPPPPPPFAWEYSRGVGACAETRGVGGGEAAGMFCSEGANAVWHAPAPQPPLPPPGHRRPGCRRATLDGEGVPCAAHEAQEHGSSGADVCADGAIVVGGEFVGGWDVPCHQQTPSQQLQQSNMISSSKLQAAAPASSSHSGRAGGTLRPVLRSGPSGTAAAGAAGPWPARPAQTLSRLHDGGSRRNSGSNVAIAVVPAAAAGSGSTGSGEARDAPAAMASSGGRSAAGPLGVAAAGTPAAVAPRELRRFASHSSTSQTATAAPAAAAAAAAAGASGAPVSWAHPAVARQLGRGGMAAPAPPATAATATASAATSGALAAARLAATAATVAAESVSAPLPLLQHTQQQHIARQHCPPTHATTPGGEHDSTPVPTPHHVQQYLQAVAAGARGGAQQLHACAEAAAAVAIAPGQQPSGAGWSATAAATAAGALPVSSRRFSRRSLDETVLARAASSHSSRSACSNGSGRGGGNARLQVQQPHWAAGAGAAGAAPSACALDAAAPAATAATGSPFLGQRRGSVGALKPSPMAPGTLAAVPSLTAIGVEDMDVGNAGGDGGGVGAWNGACIDAGAVTSVGTGGRMIAKLLKALSDFRAGE
ncbi:hypothetical protein HYH02_013180 [Chlamydomonas schloesseri]|uniref:Uncharacterized protein n=1 Tax=Chlamydomonas schloesseri TaxID=2026947 RepID=A0A835SRN7_9CHLO|nr:hypothetical protein HYH02_013180 [Chlamydomonas schloesseri]|eukprot:KAG2431964.1 hypothetical protein HYH02_013180 [Chlamydomonas schloesseri]